MTNLNFQGNTYHMTPKKDNGYANRWVFFPPSSRNTGNIKELTVEKQVPKESHKIYGYIKKSSIVQFIYYLFNGLTLK